MHEMWDYVADAYCLLAGYRAGRSREAEEAELFELSIQPDNEKQQVTAKKWVIGGAVLLSLFAAAATPVPAVAQPCTGEIGCYETPQAPFDANQPQVERLWSGYEDGRLNPDRGEYYTLYCSSQHIHVVRVVPVTQEIKTIALEAVTVLDVGDSLDVGDNMHVVLNTPDTVTIYGSNGNRAPEPGEKAFSLSECLARGESNFVAAETEELESEQSPVNALPAIHDNDPCIVNSPIGAVPCDFDFSPLEGETGLEFLWRIAFLCLGNPFGVAAIVFVPGVARLRRKPTAGKN